MTRRSALLTLALTLTLTFAAAPPADAAQQFLPASQLLKVAVPAVDGTTDVTSSGVDLTGWDGVVFFTTLPTANAGNFLKVQESTDNSSFADLAGTKVVAGSDNDVLAVDVSTPGKRYARAVLVRAGATTVSQEIYALLYGSHNAPVTQGAGVVAETHVSPAAGTP